MKHVIVTYRTILCWPFCVTLAFPTKILTYNLWLIPVSDQHVKSDPFRKKTKTKNNPICAFKPLHHIMLINIMWGLLAPPCFSPILLLKASFRFSSNRSCSHWRKRWKWKQRRTQGRPRGPVRDGSGPIRWDRWYIVQRAKTNYSAEAGRHW